LSKLLALLQELEPLLQLWAHRLVLLRQLFKALLEAFEAYPPIELNFLSCFVV
jgi:hypothetical protein